MAIFKCKMCGGNLEVQEGMSVCECEYCGSTQTVPALDDEKKINLFTRANRLRSACEFDKAFSVFESIVAEFREEAEAYWGLILCRYGIEYVDDPKTGKKIPTCHRSSFNNVMDDENFEFVMEYSDPISRAVYREEAKKIESLRTNIIEVSSKEEPYDIFICYKETDLLGERTIDSVIAQDVYDVLREKGYRVFFSRITLEDKLGQEYEPYIFAALNSAKIMLVFGTDYEYYNAVWVKNEWSRFLSLIEKGEKKTLIPCYKGIDAYDMPKEFARLQAQDMGKVGAIQDLVRGIEKIIGKPCVSLSESSSPVSVMSDTDANIAALLERAFVFLEDGEWEKAKEYCERVLDIDPKNAEAYLGKVMEELKITKRELLCEASSEIESSKSYARLVQYADENLQKEIAYAIAKQHMKFATGEKDYLKVASEFEKLQEYQDSASMRAESLNLSRRAKEKDTYLRGPRDKAKKASKYIFTSGDSTFLLKLDGTVVVCGYNGYNRFGQCDVEKWNDIIDISCVDDYTIGLKSDGTVVACGEDSYGQCDVEKWNDIVAISSGEFHTIGLKSNGTVVACGEEDDGQCDVEKWNDIVAISCEEIRTIGLKSDGTVVVCGKKLDGEYDVKKWNDIIAISCGACHTIGLKSDGTVVACGKNHDGECDVEKWNDIIAISCGACHTIGLKSDGTVVACGGEDDGQCDVEKWNDIIAISCGSFHTIGLKSDGTVLACGNNRDGQCDVENYRLFSDFETVEEEKRMLQEEKKKKEEARLKELELEEQKREEREQHRKELEEQKRVEKEQRRNELQSQRSIWMSELNSLGLFQLKEKRKLKEKIEKIEKEIKDSE